MDAVELALHVDVAVEPKLMGSEGFSRSGGVEHQNDSVSLMVTHSSSIDNENNVANMETDALFYPHNVFLETQLCNSTSQLPHLKGEELPKNMPAGNEKNCLVISSTLEGVPLHRKAAKVNKSSSSCSKRARVSQSEDSANTNGIDESNPEKSQLQKQKCNASKRADKRNFKVPSAKSKFESSSMKMGPSGCSSASGGNNVFGLYGLKHDFRDVTKLMDEPSLDELLKGTFAHPNLGKEKVKRTSSLNETFMNSVRKACSILQSPKSVHSQNTAEIDCSSNKMSPCELSSVCAVESAGNGEKDQSCTKDMSSCLKDPCSETESIASPLDSPLSQPKDVLEQIAIHPFQDLDSLLLDVSKLAITTKSTNDLRSGKQASRLPSLPSFPWLHAFGGHSRTNSDTVKLSTSRSACQGKWARIGVITNFTDIDRSSFINLDSFSYDTSLVPSSGSSGNKLLPPLFPNLSSFQWDSSSPVTCKDSQFNAELGGQVDTKENDGRCPRVIAAARTLYELATQSPRQNSFGVLRWERKTSHKAMKTCNLKSNEKLEEKPSTPISVIGSDVVSRSVGQTMPSKKPRLTIVENKNSSHSNNFKKGLCSWSTSKSSRSSPNKPVRVSTVEGKRTSTTTSVLKQHCMMPPPARDLGKAAYVGQQQVGKLVLTDWKRGRDK
ncbi:PREDICTED: uncharacterized protein LOC109349943 isoform X2 [Lupinus angustifolius]|uniref:uncharacterized protein LOC109349943 isoform X2 n=1 Tax=Lupinus angustifolius TaxID=3871 RepID=UPI00092F6491|nr:PREDICTED: uncharacterized protein LOC109349943 isoform X2 [Lupinus angustifolius]